MEQCVLKDGKMLRYGYTTGSCSAAAAKAAACMLFTGKPLEYINLITPKGFALTLEVLDCTTDPCGNWVSCGIRKDAGDDPDVTDQAVIYAKVEKTFEAAIVIDGGKGVGRVTKPGLDQPVGAAAINSTPRRMICEALTEVCKSYGYTQGLCVTISIPQGEILAEKTFNPKLGIVGGISVLGTSGIVEPMSEQALLDTIRVEIAVKKAEKNGILAIAPGNYGQAFMEKQYGFSLETAVKCSNFAGDSMEMAVQAGFTRILFTGHLGKLIKIAAGVMNTHSKYGDGRMEMLLKLTKEALQIKQSTLEINTENMEELETRIMNCVAVDDVVHILQQEKLSEIVLQRAAILVKEKLEQKVDGLAQVEVVLFSNAYGLLAETDNAQQFIDELLDLSRIEEK